MEAEEQQISKLYEAYGLAMYQAQCVEREVATLLVSAQCKEIDKSLDQLFRGNFKKTLGALIEKVAKVIQLTPDMENRLNTALSNRNWLAHNYFWDRVGEIQSLSGRNFMIAELRRIADELDTLDLDLVMINAEFFKSLGCTSEMAAQQLEQYRIDAQNKFE